MHLRYLAKFYNKENEKIEYGFFAAADYLKKFCDLEINDREQLEKLIHWFDHTLPIPDYYQDKKNRQKSKSATSWYKDSALEFINPMNDLTLILEKYNVEVERINAKKVLGKKLYEDDFQITVLPFKDAKKNIT